jgi:hypothetical protein
VVFLCTSQVDVFGLADPYVCVSAIAVPGSEKVLHDAKITAAQVSKSGQWLIKPQGMTKTVKNELNPIFEEQFVLDSTVAIQNTLAEEIHGQEVCLLVSVHDWNRTSSDVFMGACRIKMVVSNAGHSDTENQVHVIQNEAGASLTDKSGKVSTVVLSVSYEASKVESSSAPVTSHEIAQAEASHQHADAKAASEAKAAAEAKAKAEAEAKAEAAKKKAEEEAAATKKLADQEAAARKRAEEERKRAEDAAAAVAAAAERKEAEEVSVCLSLSVCVSV